MKVVVVWIEYLVVCVVIGELVVVVWLVVFVVDCDELCG